MSKRNNPESGPWPQHIPHYSQPNDQISRRGIAYPTHFHLQSLSSNHSEIAASIKIITTWGWQMIGEPFPFCHPRLVQLFYQNLRCIGDSMVSEIDGTVIKITQELIRSVLRIPEGNSAGHEYMLDGILPATMATQLDAFSTTQTSQYVCSERIPKELWFLDTIFQKNICIWGHPHERRGNFLKALFAVKCGFFLNLPGLIVAEIRGYHNITIANPSSKVTNPPLPFAHLITSCILMEPNFRQNPNELEDITHLEFTSKHWEERQNTTLKRARFIGNPTNMADLLVIDLDKDHKGKEPANIPTAPILESGQSSQRTTDKTDLSVVHEEMKKLKEIVHEYHQQHKQDMGQMFNKLEMLMTYVEVIHAQIENFSLQTSTSFQNIVNNPLWMYPASSSQLPPFPGDPPTLPPTE